jgi:tRNA A37 threonylcarbamoyladenosine dehydratase
LQEVRKKLRVRHGFPRGGEPFGVECVYSDEPPIVPPRHIEVCVSAGADEPAEEPDLRLDCATGFGTASFVTGAFGLVAASRVVRSIGARHEAA